MSCASCPAGTFADKLATVCTACPQRAETAEIEQSCRDNQSRLVFGFGVIACIICVCCAYTAVARLGFCVRPARIGSGLTPQNLRTEVAHTTTNPLPTHLDAESRIRQHEDEIIVDRTGDDGTTAPAQQTTTSKEVQFAFPSAGKLGIVFPAGVVPLTVAKKRPQGLAVGYARLKPGMTLTRVQGESVTGWSYRETLDRIASVQRPAQELVLGFAQAIDSQQHASDNDASLVLPSNLNAESRIIVEHEQSEEETDVEAVAVDLVDVTNTTMDNDGLNVAEIASTVMIRAPSEGVRYPETDQDSQPDSDGSDADGGVILLHCPTGAIPGDVVTLLVEDSWVDFIVPDEAKPGDTFDFDTTEILDIRDVKFGEESAEEIPNIALDRDARFGLSERSDSEPSAELAITLECPDDVLGGDVVAVSVGSHQYEVIIPEGVSTGEQFTVHVTQASLPDSDRQSDGSVDSDDSEFADEGFYSDYTLERRPQGRPDRGAQTHSLQHMVFNMDSSSRQRKPTRQKWTKPQYGGQSLGATASAAKQRRSSSSRLDVEMGMKDIQQELRRA
eukprot:COSAG01_NODE_391_length_17672_cov_4.507369_4_plen_560_part_00